MTDKKAISSNLRMADVPREILLGKTLRQRAHELRIEACGAWSDVVEKPIAGLDAAKCDYAKAIEERLCAIIDELADLSSPVETKARQPDGYAYRRRWPMRPGETYIAFDQGGEINGSRPIEAIPYWLGPAPPTTFPKKVTECDHAQAIFRCADCGLDLVGENRGHPERSVQETEREPELEDPQSYIGSTVGGPLPESLRDPVKNLERGRELLAQWPCWCPYCKQPHGVNQTPVTDAALAEKASEDRGRPVRPHRSGGGLPAPATERPIELIEPWSPEKASERPPLVYPDRWPCKYPRIAGSIAQDCEYPNCDCGPSENGRTEP